MAGVLYKLDRTGHGEVAKWGDDAESCVAGEVAFKSLAERGFTMFDVSDPQVGKPALRAFDPDATEIIAGQQATEMVRYMLQGLPDWLSHE